MRFLRRHSPSQFEGLAGRTRFISDLFGARDLNMTRLLDVGCGTAWFLQHLSTLADGSHLVGVDVDIEALGYASRTRSGSSLFALTAGSSLELPVAANSFDICTSWDVIEHIPRNSEGFFFSELFRVLQPGGLLYLSTPNSHLWSYLGDPAFFLQRHRHYSTDRLIELAQNAGFEIEEAVVRGRFADFLLTYNFYFSKWVLRRPPLCFLRHARLVDRTYARSRGYMTAYLTCRKPAIPS